MTTQLAPAPAPAPASDTTARRDHIYPTLTAAQIARLAAHGRRRPPCPKCKSRAVAQVYSAFFAKTVRKS